MKYLLTFKPLKNFFFGNDKTFSDDYLAISEYFPQNTQLLGALRLFISEQNKLMHVHRNGKYSNEPNELKKLIGTASSKDFNTNTDLGKIQNLSQMFLVNNSLDDAYFPIPLDVNIQLDTHGTQIMGDDGKIHTVQYPQKAKLVYYEVDNIDGNYFLKNYDAKNSSFLMLGNKNFWNAYINKEPRSINGLHYFEKNEQQHNGIFISHAQVGIGLENKKTIEGAFYSKTDYQLKNGFLFGCLIELDEEIVSDGIIQIGAESSLFELKITPYEKTQLTSHPIVSQLFTQPQKGDKVVAISDVILESTDEFHAHFTILPFYKNFAMIEADDNSFRGISKDKNHAKFRGKTEQKRLIPAGTVSFIKEQVMPHNQTLGAYAKMGFNQFITAKN
jgi:CRISPR type III-B/RAMP module-associated protein Cmr3